MGQAVPVLREAPDVSFGPRFEVAFSLCQRQGCGRFD